MKNYLTNDVVIAILAVTILILIIAVFTVAFFFVYQRKKTSQLRQIHELNEKALQLESKFRNELLQAQLEIQEQTMKTISEEIHDNIGQALTLAKLNLSTMLPLAGESLLSKIIDSKELVAKSINDLRDLSHSLNTDYVQEMGLQRAVEYELERIQKSGAVNTVMEINGNLYRLPRQKELILFRIVQEAFNNSLKHSGAAEMKVNISYSPELFRLSVEDNGIGADAVVFRTMDSGLGIRNIKNRAQLINALLTLESSPGNGMKIIISLPVEMKTNDE